MQAPDARWRDILLIGLFLSLGQFGLLYLSLHLGMPPGLASLVVQVQVIFTVVIAALRPPRAPHQAPAARRPHRAGRPTVVALGRTADTPLLALMLCLAGALSWATGNVVTRRVGTASGLSMTVWSGLVVPVPLFALSLLVDGPEAVANGLRHIDAVTIGSTLYTAYLCSLFGYGVWNSLLVRYPTAVRGAVHPARAGQRYRHGLGLPRRAAHPGHRRRRSAAPPRRPRHRRLTAGGRPRPERDGLVSNPGEAFTG